MSGFVRANVAAMAGYVPGEQPKEGEAVKLNTNENPYRATEKAYDAIRAVADRGLSRYPNAVAQPFREAAAALYGVYQLVVLGLENTSSTPCGHVSPCDALLTFCPLMLP